MPRKYYPNESRPLTIRLGAIRDDLDARCDGTESGYRSVIVRDLKRYYELLESLGRDYLPLSDWELRGILKDHPHGCLDTSPDDGVQWTVTVSDALERARILVTHAGMTVDAALVAVGLVKEEKERVV
jgi:hypothetical protein